MVDVNTNSMAVTTSRNLKDSVGDLNETRRTIENAENRARLDRGRRTEFKVAGKDNREYAQALHREADQLYRSGDYETALVLYHRAASLCPRDSSHGAAARRTAATISSCNNPAKAARKDLPGDVESGERLTAAICPETAAVVANERLKKSPEPSSIAEVLSYFDNHKSYWRTLPTARISTSQLAKSKMMLKQLNSLAETTLENLRSSFDSGKMTTALKTAEELLELSEGFKDPSRYQIAAYHYLSLIHVALGRHDRAVCCVSRLIRLSKCTEDVAQFCRSLVTLGKVHLSFGHLEAAAKAWEYLSKDLKKPIPVAWIRHEIGRCHLETGKYGKAIEMGLKCVEAAIKGNSNKWLMNGRLLLGQSLAKVGRFAEALEELQIAAKITEEEGDTPLLSYIRDLIDQVSCALRRIENRRSTMVERDRKPAEMGETKDTNLFSRDETVITTVFSHRRVITERREDSSSEDASANGDEEITMHSDRTSLPRSYDGVSRSEDLQKNQQPSAGSSTFRIEESTEEMDDVSSSSSSFSSDTLSNVDEHEEKNEDSEENLEQSTSRTNIEEEDESNRESSSKVSLRSADTTATYTVEERSAFASVKRAIDNEDEDSALTILAKVDDSDEEQESRIVSVKLTSEIETVNEEDSYESTAMEISQVDCKDGGQRQDMLNAFRVIEQLGKKDEVELLEMLRDMLLGTDDEDRLEGPGDSGDGFRSGSGEDRRNEVASNRSTRVVSLASTPRKCDADGDFRDRGLQP